MSDEWTKVLRVGSTLLLGSIAYGVGRYAPLFGFDAIAGIMAILGILILGVVVACGE